MQMLPLIENDFVTFMDSACMYSGRQGLVYMHGDSQFSALASKASYHEATCLVNHGNQHETT